MLLIQAKDLESNGIHFKNAKNICFQGHSFVRGVTFSKRLRQAASDLYQEESATENDYLIVDEETHFTFWRQINEEVKQTAAEPGKSPSQSPVQDFIQSFVAAKRGALPQPRLTTNGSGSQKKAASFTESTLTSLSPAGVNNASNQTTPQRVAKSHPTSFKIASENSFPPTSQPPFTIKSGPTSFQDVDPLMSDPFSSPYLGPLFTPSPATY
ncbi:MAG: hypothetical protein QNJ46_33455 [Leptolyngbyaceae cyanobacterium MO_188.B28]|nr:hypothetical protein [Leptolyngbyaceae cyanobacterium MO_188.B28]